VNDVSDVFVNCGLSVACYCCQVKQPMFGANYIKGDVISEPEGNTLLE